MSSMPPGLRRPYGSYGCVVGCRTKDGSGAILLFESEDGFAWRFATVLDRCWNKFGSMWEGLGFYAPQTPLSADGISFQSQGKTVINVEKYDIL